MPNKAPNTSSNAHVRIPSNSLKNNGNYNQPRERTSTMLLPPTKTNLVTTIRPNSNNCEQTIGNNIPTDKNIEHFKMKLESILTRASLSHRRESLWEKLIASRPEQLNASGRQEVKLTLNSLIFIRNQFFFFRQHQFMLLNSNH